MMDHEPKCKWPEEYCLCGINEAIPICTNELDRHAYDRGYRAGYTAGLQAALDIARQPNVYVAPTCPDCGHPLTSDGCEECGDA